MFSLPGIMVSVPLARNRRRCARAAPVPRSLLIRTSTPYLPRAHMSTRDFNSLGLTHGRLHAGFLLGLAHGWWSTGGLLWWSTCDTQRLVYALRTSSTLLLLLKPWFPGNFHFTADGAFAPQRPLPILYPQVLVDQRVITIEKCDRSLGGT